MSQRKGGLLVLVFTAGMTGLGVELAAARLLDPFFGNSIVVWANLIGLVLIYFSLGYWIGGRWADRDPRETTLYQLCAWAGLGVGIIPWVAAPILHWSVQGLAQFDFGILLGSFLGVLALFSVPMTLLGCVSPFAIRLAVREVGHSGHVAGSIYALSTLGSILGTFLPVLVLVPNIGTRRTFLFFALVLLGVSLANLWRCAPRLALRYLWMPILVGGLAFLWHSQPIRAEAETVYETESMYNYIRVTRSGDDYWLQLNEGLGIHSVYSPHTVLSGGIWDYFLIAPYFNPPPYTAERVRSLLLIGLAAGTVATQYTAIYGAIPIDGVELDPVIIEVGRRWFAMNQPNLHAVAADGRYYLHTSKKQYAVIAVDAYRPPYIPFHLTTREFFQQVRAHLTQDGVVAVNAARSETDYALVNALASTLKAVFPSVFVLDEPGLGRFTGNSLVIATRQPARAANLAENAARMEHALLREVAARSLTAPLWEVHCADDAAWTPASPAATFTPVTTCMPPFTDDWAPVEQVVHGLILRYLLSGDAAGEAEEPAQP
ncbi:MAG: fused MFS/spermidine synthase [Anaerolineae bacterium]|nr:fused MFS/spermidine synthase [Anaerolineae bacterium]MDW8071110.1 fused MFS/spermidine synthase [Anaerolineae bacterium]